MDQTDNITEAGDDKDHGKTMNDYDATDTTSDDMSNRVRTSSDFINPIDANMHGGDDIDYHTRSLHRSSETTDFVEQDCMESFSSSRAKKV